jgi:adenine-specific DNA-methyltransferase
MSVYSPGNNIGNECKILGQYYTDSSVAEFMTQWSIRNAEDVILEPSFGEGVFLASVQKHLNSIGGNGNQIYGVERDENNYRKVHDLTEILDIPKGNLFLEDFFKWDSKLLKVNVVIGNPPFIRYHRFKGDDRLIALKRAKETGVAISGSTSSWAPFIAYATSFLKYNGRLAMVVPGELLNANYARSLLIKLQESFSTIKVVSFKESLFPDLCTNIQLLLCEGFGISSKSFRVFKVNNIRELKKSNLSSESGYELKIRSIVQEGQRPILYSLPEDTQELYKSLISNPYVIRLDMLMNIKIGYVTGNNDYFHLSYDDIKKWEIEFNEVRQIIRRGRDLCYFGLSTNEEIWSKLDIKGKYFLFYPNENPSKGAKNYICFGERNNVNKGFKCSNRNPWWVTPDVKIPDLFLPVMCNEKPRLVANKGCFSGTNTLLAIYQNEKPKINSLDIAATSLSSLFQLSAEIEGHTMGGGSLKFEPSEARQILIPDVRVFKIDKSSRERINLYISANEFAKAAELVDNIYLREGLNLTNQEISIMRQSTKFLKDNRINKI